MQPDRTRELIRMFVARIINDAFPNETAAARLHQVGLFTLIWMMEGQEEPVTATKLSEMTGLADAQVIRHLQKLIKRGLVERKKIPNRQGRGRAYQLTIKHTAKTRRLVKAIEHAAGK